MSVRWIGLAIVVALVAVVLVVKQTARPARPADAVVQRPSVLLVADLREADEPGDACAEIIRMVRDAAKRGVRVQELTADSGSDLVRRHRVLTVPTVLILGDDGRELGRFEGESREVVDAVRARLGGLPASGK